MKIVTAVVVCYNGTKGNKVLPMNTRAIGTTARMLCIAVCLFAASLFLATFPTASTSAVALPVIAEVDLPIGDTVLDQIVTPITDQTNQLIPVQINSTPDTLGAEVALPAASPQETSPPLIDVTVNTPVVPALINTVTNPATPDSIPAQVKNRVVALSPTTPPSQNNSAGNLPAQTVAAAAPHPAAPITHRSPSAATTSELTTKLPFSPLLVGAIGFLGQNLLVNSTGGLVTAIPGSTVTLVPIIVSIGIFLLMIALVVSVVYIMDHTNFTLLRGGRLAHFAEVHDLTQIAAAAIIMCGAILITLFLVMTYF